MKKFWLFATLLLTTLLFAWCIRFNVNFNNSSSTVDEDKPSLNTESGRLFVCNEEAGKYYNITTFWGSWDTEEEAWASFVLNWEITFEENWETVHKTIQCVVDMVENSVEINPYSDKSDEEFEVDQSEISE